MELEELEPLEEPEVHQQNRKQKRKRDGPKPRGLGLSVRNVTTI